MGSNQFFWGFSRILFPLGFYFGGVVTIIMGVISILGFKSVKLLAWAIVPIIVGSIAEE